MMYLHTYWRGDFKQRYPPVSMRSDYLWLRNSAPLNWLAGYDVKSETIMSCWGIIPRFSGRTHPQICNSFARYLCFFSISGLRWRFSVSCGFFCPFPWFNDFKTCGTEMYRCISENGPKEKDIQVFLVNIIDMRFHFPLLRFRKHFLYFTI